MHLSLKLEKRLEESRAIGLLVPVGSLLLALVFGAVLLALAGANPWQTYRAMLEGAFGTPEQWQAGDFYALTETLVKATPLMLCGLAVSIAFRMLFWNIGAEGQLVMGGFAAGAVALWLPGLTPCLPSWAYLPLMGAAGIVAGAAWGVVPGLLKAYLRVNEIITTLMLNYIAILWVQHLYYGPWKDPEGFGFPGTAQFEPFTWLPRLTGRVHLGLILAVLAAVFIWVVLGRTRWGYEIRLIGENPTAARYAGVGIARNIVLVMFLSGGLAGLAGMAEVAGISHRLQQGLAVGYGFTAIIVAWLGRLNPWGVLLVGFLLAALLVGGDQIQITMGLPASVALVLQGAILFCMLGGNILTTYRVRLVRNVTAVTRPAVVPGSRTGGE
jgi:general nucleoside transport system permease protein